MLKCDARNVKNFPKILLIAGIVLLLVIPGASAASSVTRSVSTSTPTSGSVVEVVLTVEDLACGGIVETLPPGCVVSDTEHPADQVSVSEHSIVFAVFGEPEIRYTFEVTAPCDGSITGTWAAFDSGKEGTIPAARIATTGGTTSSSQQSPGFSWLAGGAALCVAVLLAGRRAGGV